MSVATITRRMLARLPDGAPGQPFFNKNEPEVTEEYNATNGSFEIAGASSFLAADWTRTTSAPGAFAASGTSQGRIAPTLLDPASSDPLYPIVRGTWCFVLGEFAAVKPARSVENGDLVEIVHSQRWEPKDFTHVAFRYHYLSEPSWSAPGIWQAELLVDGTSLWAVDLFSGAAHYVTNQEVSLAAVPAGFRQLTFRLVYNGTDPYTGPLPTFLIDDVRFLKRTSSLETILWLFLWGVATVVKDAADAQAAIASLLRITDAYGVDLERLGADYGIKKPITLGLSDAQYRNLIRQCIVEPKKTLLAIKDLIRTLTGANPVSMTELPPVGSAPPELVIVLDGGFLTPDIADLVDFWFYG